MKLIHHSERNWNLECVSRSYEDCLGHVKKWCASEGKGKSWPETEEEIDAVMATMPKWVNLDVIGDLDRMKNVALPSEEEKKIEDEEIKKIEGAFISSQG